MSLIGPRGLSGARPLAIFELDVTGEPIAIPGDGQAALALTAQGGGRRVRRVGGQSNLALVPAGSGRRIRRVGGASPLSLSLAGQGVRRRRSAGAVGMALATAGAGRIRPAYAVPEAETLLLFRRDRYLLNGLLHDLGEAATFARPGPADWINVAGDGLEAQAASAVLRRGPVRGALFQQAQAGFDNNAALNGWAAGTPGSAPTGWSILATTNGLSRQIVGTQVINGVTCLLVRYSGTPTLAAQTLPMRIGTANPRSIGDTVSHGIFVSLAAGTLANLSGWQLRAGNETGATSFTPTATQQWITNTRVLAATVGELVIRVGNIDNTTPVDFTLAVGLPTTVNNGGQVLGPIRTSGGGNVLRPGDVLSLPASIAAGADWTVAGVAMMPLVSVAASHVVALGASASEAFVIRRGVGDPSTLVAQAVVGGVGQTGANTAPGIAAPGAVFGWAMRRSGANMGLSINGGAPINAAPASMPSAALASLAVGHNLNGGQQWNGFIEGVLFRRGAVADAAMQQYASLAFWDALA